MKKRILFLCTGNSCRSQMAEGWCRHLWSDRYDCFSAGTQKHGMNTRAVKSMLETGIDISKHFSKTTNELPENNFDFVVTVCNAAKEACPYFPGGKIVHVGFQDPPQLTKDITNEADIMNIYNQVRDEIKKAIQKLPELLGDDQ